jgi:hypothetical protein
MAGIGLDAALGEFVRVAALEPGTCIAYAEESFDIATVVPCSEDGADLLFGLPSARAAEYPGDNKMFEEGTSKCNKAASDYEAASGQFIDRQEIAVIVPFEIGYNALDRRTLLCVVLANTVETDTPAITQPEPDVSDLDLVELVPPEGFVFGQADPVCSIETDTFGDTSFFEAACNEPHNAELVALIEPPGETLPADEAEATIFFNEMCASPVADATGADMLRPGIGIGFNVPGALGEAYEGSVACYAKFGAVVLVGSFQDIPFIELIGDQVVIAGLDPGECFLFAESSFASGYVASCDEADAHMAVGEYQAEDRPYPGTDALREERAQRCAVVLAESGLVESGVAGDPDTLSGSFPGENAWNVPGRRLVTCDIDPAQLRGNW